MILKTLASVEIIGISGKQFSGKDVLTAMLLKHLPGFRQVPIAAAIKQRYAKINSLTLDEIETHKADHRAGLIALGDQGRSQDPDYWLHAVLNTPGKKIVSDIRLQREAALFRRYGAFLIRLNADRSIRAHRGRLQKEDDPTECELDTWPDWDWVLSNNGTLEEMEDLLKCS